MLSKMFQKFYALIAVDEWHFFNFISVFAGNHLKKQVQDIIVDDAVVSPPILKQHFSKKK